MVNNDENLMKKISIEFNLCKEIQTNQKNIMNELDVILKEQDGYKYNQKNKKLKKHFPASVNMSYDEYNLFLIENENNVSFSLSSKSINEQKNVILQTALRRCNYITMFDNDNDLWKILCTKHTNPQFPIFSLIDLRHNLNKYENETNIKNRFPYFIAKNKRSFYDVIYSIKTENPCTYINSHAKEKTVCDTILICCNKKTINIFFELDKINPYYSHLKNYNIIGEETIKKIYNNIHI